MITYTLENEWTNPSRIIMDGLLAFNAAYMELPSEQKLAITATEGDGQQVVAGLLGQTYHAWLNIGWLWTSEKYRNQGIGTELMRRAEAEALLRGCHHAHLTTLDFQAREFYERLGYSVFGILEDYPRPHRRFFMQKGL